ncbi:MAG: T9SS type A sorting domain-containing protein, partial [Paraprevotella sp.]|nr:T9SS type A sorting domain-containing protein [Paraprevotella sp.]
WVAVQVERCVEESCTEPSTILAITADPVTVQASQTAAISVTGGNNGPIAFTVTPATGAVTGNDGAYSFSATEVGDYVINATQADFNGVCGGNATCVISVTAIGSLTAPTITATDLNGNTENAFTFCETDNDDALKVEATSPEEGVTYTYQWYVKETDSNVFTAITGATEAIYPPTMDGTYYCEVTAKKPGYASASAKSKEWTITITQSTAIISQPTSVALEGGQATLEVEAEGENLQYQWYSCEDDDKTNAQAIAGATNASYTTTQTGYYYVVVSSDCGVDRTSDVVEVTKEVEYCFNMTDLIKAKKTTINSQSELTSTHATITGGTVLYDRVAGETMELNENGLKFNSNSDYLKVTLTESALANGTVIEFTYYVGSTGRGIKILKSDKTTEICSNAKTGSAGTATYSFTITEEMQEEVFYITRVGGTAYLQSLRVSDCGAVCSDNTPTLSASTNNISASTEVTLTASNYTGGATLSFYKEGVAEPLQTGAGNTCTVTVDVTSTFYVVAVNDCERRSESVTVTFTCGTLQPKIIQVGGVLGCNETVTLKAVTQEGKDITGDDGTLQWYKNGVAIDGANDATLILNLEDVGEYTVSLTDGCMAMSTNTAVVSNEVPEPELEVLAPRQYYQLNHDYTEEQQLRYLMKLTLPEGTDVAGATDGAYQITATLEENTLDATQFVENKIEEGVYWIMLNLNSLTANADTYGLAAGNIISIKVTPLNLCGEYPAELARTVEVKVTDKPTLAFIVSGADGNGTKEKKSHKVNGDFLTGYNKADLCLQTGTTSFDNTQELPLYTYLKEYFEVVPVNGYAPYNYYNYDPFDIALLTDFPKTKAGVGNDTLISAANLNALADLVDRKPLLSLKTHMVNTALGAWSEKGFIENPLTTKNQVNMTLLCHAHEMFKEDISIAPDDEGNVQVDILTQVGFDANKGMQGFRALASTNFINIATTVNSADNTNLVACCERQANVQARMLLLSINADATSFISDNGKIVIRNALHYLLQTDPTHVSDCSIVFDNGGGVGRTVTLKGTTYTSGDNEWGNPANWSTSTLPNQANNVLIEANCQVTNVHSQTGVGVYGVANVRINENYTLTIAPTGGIVSTGLFAVYKPGEKYNAIQITDPKYVTVQANETNTGLLMHSHQETLHATVQMYSPANHDKEGGYNTAGFHKVKNYTDVAVPVEVDATFFQNNGHEAQYWKWNEKGTVGFERQTTGTVPHFQGGCISHCDPQLFSFAGQVALAKDHPFEMTYTEGGWYGINVVGNSWTAPIQILELTAADFGSNLEQTIYIYNTGHDAEAGTGVASQADFSTPGQWMAVPIETAKTGDWNGPKVIPAMQAFQVLTLYPLVTPADGETQAESQTLTIGYNKHIRCRGAVNGLTQKLYAPQRPKKAPRTGLPSTAEVLMPDPNKVDTFVTPTMLRVMFVADSVKTDVYLFEDDQRFKNGFDNGWDGTYQNDETVSGAYVLTEAGNMAISAQPYLEGTTVALKSKKTTTFQCTFKYTGTETLYLNDTKLEQSTKIEEGASYMFMASPEDAPNRFVISAEPYQGSITGMAGVVMVDNALVVNNPLQEPLRVFIYDAVGRTHHVYDTKAAMEEINLPNVPGVYLIRVKGENTDLVHKVVR